MSGCNVCLYAFRADTVTLTGQYQYPDNKPGDVDAFSREPFVVRFKASKAGQSSATHCPTWSKVWWWLLM